MISPRVRRAGLVALVACGACAAFAARLVCDDGVAARPVVAAGRQPAVAERHAGERSPIHLAVAADGRRAYVVNHTSDSVSVLDLETRQVMGEIASVGPRPDHATLAPDGRRLYVSSLHGAAVQVVDLVERRVIASFRTGYEPWGHALTPDGAQLCVASVLEDKVTVLDSGSGAARREIPVGRSPRYLAATPDGARLLVGNVLSRDVSLIDLAAGRVTETRGLGRAAILRQVACTHDGRWGIVASLVSHDEKLPLQMERGWIHSNGITFLDLDRPGHYVTLLLDRLLAGAANPWGLAVAPDDRRLYVTLSGVHEVAIVDLPRALALVAETRPEEVERRAQDVEILARRGIARRVDAGGLGPRGLALRAAAGELLVANYFSDTVSVLDAETGALRAVIPLGPTPEPTLERKGELLFNDARITFQTWFSCASCHQEDATIDGLNWDLPNDGLGNAKNVKSLHDAYDTPPSMWTGVRKDMDAAVQAGQRFQGFLPEGANHRALMAYFSAPQRAPNPYRTRDPAAVRRGERVFQRARCDTCHPPPKYTDLKMHDLGLATPSDFGSRFDTPSLRECYRTAPYLHDGRAATLREVLTTHNPADLHGRVSGLGEKEIEDLVEFLRSL